MSTYIEYDDIYIYYKIRYQYIYMCIYIKKNMYIFTKIHIYIDMYFFCCDMSMTQMAQLTCPCSACGNAAGIHCAPLVTYIFTLLYKYISMSSRQRGCTVCPFQKCSVELSNHGRSLKCVQ